MLSVSLVNPPRRTISLKLSATPERSHKLVAIFKFIIMTNFIALYDFSVCLFAVCFVMPCSNAVPCRVVSALERRLLLDTLCYFIIP